jgi:hypothetical protein
MTSCQYHLRKRVGQTVGRDLSEIKNPPVYAGGTDKQSLLRESGRQGVMRQNGADLSDEMLYEIYQHEQRKQQYRLFLHCIFDHPFCTHDISSLRPCLFK